MNTVDIDKPIRLTRAFWVTYAFFGLPVLWYVKPWLWQQPIYSIVAAFVFFPFAAAIVAYCSFLFILAVALGGESQRRPARAFATAIICAALFLAIGWISGGYKGLSVAASFGAAFFATVIFRHLNPGTPNQLPDPTSPTVTPPAVAGGAPSVAADH
jgi:hypothetical protein